MTVIFGLPKSTEISKQLPKKAIYAKFNMNTAAKEKFDADISKISIVAEISPNTINISKGEKVSAVYVLLVTLKKKSYDEKNLVLLSKLIEQNMLFVLEFENERRTAIYRSKLLQSEWVPSEELTVNLKGLNLDVVWENLIKEVGKITLSDGNTLDEQIAENEQQEKLQKEIERLEKAARRENQPNKKYELVQKIKKLRMRNAELTIK